MTHPLTLPRFERLFYPMKSSVLLVLLATAATGYAEMAVVPERFPLDRYSKLKSEAPFAVKTADELPAEAKVDWAKDYYLSGASKHTENGTEKEWVYINHTSDPSAGFQLLSGEEPNAQGFQFVKLDWHPENPVLTEVHIKKGNEFAIIKRDRAAYTAPAGQPQPGVVRPNNMVRPGQPNPTAIPNANGAIRQPVVQPRGPVIPRPGGNNAVPPPGQNLPRPVPGAQQQQQQQQNQGDRRRIRVINSR